MNKLPNADLTIFSVNWYFEKQFVNIGTKITFPANESAKKNNALYHINDPYDI